MTRALVVGCFFGAVSCTGALEGGTSRIAEGTPAEEAAGCEPTTFALTRLNRRELDATFAALWKESSAPAQLFTADSVAPGRFDNTASELVVAPRLVVDLEGAAGKIVDAAWARDDAILRTTTPQASGGATQQQLGRMAQATVGAARGDDWNVWSNGEARFAFTVASAGLHQLELDVYGEQAGSEPVRMDVWLNGAFVRTDEVRGTQSSHTLVRFDATLPAGALTVGLRFQNDLYDAATNTDRNLLVSKVTVIAPSQGAGTPSPPSVTPLLQRCSPSSGEAPCARSIIEHFARKAWRRPASGDELAGLMNLYTATRADGDDFATATKLALRAIIVSPNFLFRTEAVMLPTGPKAAEAVAARLSFFLWGGPPDDALDAVVDEGRLLEAGVLEAQVDRMLADGRSSALRSELVSQWLDTRDVQGFALDPGLFPGVNQAVMKSVGLQMGAFVEEFFFGDRDALDALDAPVTFVDAPLASFLGLPAPAGTGIERRTLEPGHLRAGLLAQSAPLIVTSKSTETDPPRRGKWVMERLLCQPVPLPVGIDIPPVPAPSPQKPTARDRLEALTSPGACAGCHSMLNPIGFGLEPYDADSRHRTMDHGATIDSAGTFRDRPFTKPSELYSLLKADPALERCMVEKTFSYALARPVEAADAETVDALAKTFARGHRYRELVRAVALGPTMVNGCQLKR